MNLRQLEYFYEIIKCGSFSRAAEKLYVAQPAISMSFKQLEEEIGLQLIYRQKNKISLTLKGGKRYMCMLKGYCLISIVFKTK